MCLLPFLSCSLIIPLFLRFFVKHCSVLWNITSYASKCAVSFYSVLFVQRIKSYYHTCISFFVFYQSSINSFSQYYFYLGQNKINMTLFKGFCIHSFAISNKGAPIFEGFITFPKYTFPFALVLFHPYL